VSCDEDWPAADDAAAAKTKHDIATRLIDLRILPPDRLVFSTLARFRVWLDHKREIPASAPFST